MKNKIVREIYEVLFSAYGPQGWWPLSAPRSRSSSRSIQYHPDNYQLPKTRAQIYEICLGAILTQNTAWMQAEKALLNLLQANAADPERIMELDPERLKRAIRPAGYFNLKSRKIKAFTEFYLSLKGRTPDREELLGVWGIGEETADSILLYAYKVPVFVADSYTRRIFSNLGLIGTGAPYREIQRLFNAIKPDLKTCQEYHALIVRHAKNHYRNKNDYSNCPLYLRYSAGKSVR